MKNMSLVVAVGGNAIIKENQKGTIDEQLNNIRRFCKSIANLYIKGYRIVLSHGNGPHVGNLLLQNEAEKSLPRQPIDVCDALTQGQIGYMLQQSLHNALVECGAQGKIATLITQCVVSKDDVAFQNPTKPIGPFFSAEDAQSIMGSLADVTMKEDAGRGYRRVVASPLPKRIVEKDGILELSNNGYIVIAAGGGGIPVVEEGGKLRGVEAVIDKDYSSALLAQHISSDCLLLLTGVDRVCVDFNKPNQRALVDITLDEAKKHLSDGQFPEGSMGPKMRAAIEFLNRGGKKVIITSIEAFEDALDGKNGTSITHA